ncbi:MAG: phosphatidylserine decarboxylase family protein, partial [Flavobacteriaceae bacterium]|nr:phosphatidylserine decarboxylase family protein [Flavobacteriaceae bacterium]
MFHKEGYTIITVSFIIIAIINLLSVNFIDNEIITKSIGSITIIVLVLILQFFRNPKRNTKLNDELIISPVDGKVVAIEKVFEKEYFKDERIQIS